VREQVELRWNFDGDRPGRARARKVEGAANVSPEIFNVDNLDKKWW